MTGSARSSDGSDSSDDSGLSLDLWHFQLESAVNGRQFIPLDKLDAVLTQSAIESELAAAGLRGAGNKALLEYITNHARKIFAILVIMEEHKRIEALSVSGLADADLPLGICSGRIVRSLHSTSDALNMSTEWPVFRKWRAVLVRSFCEFQWLVLAPKIIENEFALFVHGRCPLPFMQPLCGTGDVIFSHHSKVRKLGIHEAHFQRADGQCEGLQVAVKELYPTQPDEEQSEARSLAKLSRLDHPHLIKCIATYRQSGVYYSIFPWADGGNLRQFWASEDHLPRNIDLITWAVQQMAGIASGTVALHNFSLQENCRHGDLKPQNILCFRGAAGASLGTLVVSDLGSAKFHSDVTGERRQTGSNVGYGTLRYEPPEALLMTSLPRSRRYDVWSVGCIFLEFLIWLLYGWRGLTRFYEGIDKYWMENQAPNHQMDSDGSAVLGQVHPKVQDYMRRMRNDPRCIRGSAIGDLLKVVEDRLLVPRYTHRKGMEDDDESVSDQLDIDTTGLPLEPPSNMTSCLDPPTLRIRMLPAQWKTESLLDNSPIRADSVELDRLLREILGKVEKFSDYVFQRREWAEVEHTGFPPPLQGSEEPESGKPGTLCYLNGTDPGQINLPESLSDSSEGSEDVKSN